MLDNREVAKASLLMAVVLAVCRFASLGKELYVASIFGAGVVVDAYALALMIPALGVSFYVNAVRRAFLAQYPKHEAVGAEAASHFANQFLISLLAVSVFLAVAISFGLRSILPRLVFDTNPKVIAGFMELTIPAAWMIVPMSLVSGFIAILNVRHRFSSPQWTHVIPTAGVIVALLFLGRGSGARGLLYGLLAGSTLQCGVLWWMASRSGHRTTWRINWRISAFTALWMLSFPFIVLDALGQGNVYIDRAMATTLDQGKVSVLYWSALMKDFISGTWIASILWVLMPHFSEQVQRGETHELRRSCALILRYSAVLLFPISALLVVCGPPLLSHFQLGQFDADAARWLVWCVAAYGLGLYAELASPALAQAMLVLGRIRTLVLIGIFGSFLPNIVLNLLLIRPLGVVGLALSTSLVAWLTLICHYLTLRRSLGIDNERRCVRTVMGSLMAAVVMGVVGFAFYTGVVQFWPDRSWSELVGGVAAAAVGLAVYFALMLIYPGNDDARAGFKILREKVRM